VFSVAVPFNSTGVLSTDGNVVGGALEFQFAGFGSYGAGDQFVYMSTGVLTANGQSMYIGGFGDARSAPSLLSTGNPTEVADNVFTLQANYLGSGNILVRLYANGDLFTQSTNVTQAIFSTGGLGGFTGFGVEQLSTLSAQIYGSTQVGGHIPVMIVS
jgi:hypothetical protein